MWNSPTINESKQNQHYLPILQTFCGNHENISSYAKFVLHVCFNILNPRLNHNKMYVYFVAIATKYTFILFTVATMTLTLCFPLTHKFGYSNFDTYLSKKYE